MKTISGSIVSDGVDPALSLNRYYHMILISFFKVLKEL